MATGRMYVSMGGDEFKEDTPKYQKEYKEEQEDEGYLIDWKNANIEELVIEDNNIRISMACRNVFVDVTVPLTFELKLQIAKELKADIVAIKELTGQ